MKEKKSIRITIAAGYLLITLLISGIIYTWFNEWWELESLEKENQQINDFRKDIHNVYVRMMELSLLGESILEWEDKDVETYHILRISVDSILCQFKKVYPSERIDSVRNILEDKEQRMKNIMMILNKQNELNDRISERVPVIVQRSTQEETKKSRRKGFLGLFGKKEKQQPTTTTTMLYTLNKDVITQQEVQNRQLSEHTDSLATRNTELNRLLQRIIFQMDMKVQDYFQRRELDLIIMQEHSFLLMGGLTGVAIMLLLFLYIIIHWDIKARERDHQKLEETLRQNNILLDMRKNIILTISHDIRGPLNVIGGSVELAMGTREKKKRDYHLKNVELLCKHMLHLLNNLLDVYRLNEFKETMSAVPFRLSDFLNRIVASVVHIVNNKGLLFVHDFKGTDVTVMGDMNRIERIIDNLLTNAIKFTKAGSIDFSSVYANSRLTMTISDTGIGMTKETLEHIFLPFQRTIDDTNTDGFGLGLSITKGLVSLLGGTIDVTSDVGKGTAFRISLPLPEVAEIMEEEVVIKETPLNLPHHVLVIDDDPMQLEVIKEILERNGVACTICSSVKDVVKAMRCKDYNMLLSDIQMPGTNGFDLLTLLRSSSIGNSRTIPVIAMTARGDREKKAYLDAGFTACIYKPFSSSGLLNLLSTIKKRREDENRKIDFSAMLSEVNDKVKLLCSFIEQSRQDAKELASAMNNADRKKLRETAHRMQPMWKLLQMEETLSAYRVLLKDRTTDDDAVREHTHQIIECTAMLIAEAENEIKKMINETENTDC